MEKRLKSLLSTFVSCFSPPAQFQKLGKINHEFLFTKLPTGLSSFIVSRMIQKAKILFNGKHTIQLGNYIFSDIRFGRKSIRNVLVNKPNK